jgi:hypothetical protein
MNNKNKVMDYLMISSEEYDEMILNTFWNWCDKWATSGSVFQGLVANSALNKWFLQQHSRLEKDFIDLVEFFPNKFNNAKFNYHSCTAEIFLLYPKPLINACKNNIDYSMRLNEKIIVYAN